MRNRLVALALAPLLLTACTTTTPVADRAAPPSAPAVCPDGLETRLRAVYDMSFEDDQRVPLLHVQMSAEEIGWTDDAPAVFTPVTAAQASALGLSPSFEPVWVLTDGAPCRMEPGPLERLELSIGGPRYATFVQRLSGECGIGEVRWALQQPAAPEGCHFIEAGRGPAESVDLPEAMIHALTPETCKEPGCIQQRMERLAVAPGGAAVVELHASRYNRGEPNGVEEGDPDCDSVELFHGSWVRHALSAPWVALETDQSSTGLIYDARGGQAMVSHFLAQWAVHDLTGKLLAGDVLDGERWLAHRFAIHHVEDGADDLDPCGL